MDVPGKVIFAPIAQLPKNWWEDPETVWDVWERDTYYLWGANLGNYRINPMKTLGGGGMASSDGPSRGKSHAHYVGVITTSISFEENDVVFARLERKLREGANIVVPIYHGRFSLGTGHALNWFSSKRKWYQTQKYLVEKILELSMIASAVEIPERVYWPDCMNGNEKRLPIQHVEDLQKIIEYLN